MAEGFTVGCDPEFFVRNPNSGNFIPAWGMIEGTKAEPKKVDKGAVQVDGFALEINIDPASTEEEFVANILTVSKQLKEMVPGYKIIIAPYATFKQEDCDQLPKEAWVVGCDPDYNAYTGLQNQVLAGLAGLTRYGAGHVHAGWSKNEDVTDPVHFADCRTMVKQLDHTVGLPSLFWDTSEDRRRTYGRPGNFRPKPYGCEYRTPSNQWLKDVDHMKFVFRQTVLAYDMLMKGEDLDKKYQGHGKYWFGVNDRYNPLARDRRWWEADRYKNLYFPHNSYKHLLPVVEKKKAVGA